MNFLDSVAWLFLVFTVFVAFIHCKDVMTLDAMQLKFTEWTIWPYGTGVIAVLWLVFGSGS